MEVEEWRSGAASGERRAGGVSGGALEQGAGGAQVVAWESLDLLAREMGQPAGRIAGWREEFLQAGREGLKLRPAPEGDRRLLAAQRKVGELQLEVDILWALLEKKGSPPSPRRVTAACVVARSHHRT